MTLLPSLCVTAASDLDPRGGTVQCSDFFLLPLGLHVWESVSISFYQFPFGQRGTEENGNLHCIPACGPDVRNLTLVSGWGCGSAQQRSSEG